MRCFPFILTSIFYSLSTFAQGLDSLNLIFSPDTLQKTESSTFVKKQKLKRTFHSLNHTDTTYITPNYYNYTVMLQNTNFYQSYNLSSKTDIGTTQSITLSPRAAFKVGPYFGWRWLFFGYAFDLSRPNQAGKATDLSLSIYTSKIGFDYVYIRSNSYFSIDRINGFENTSSKDLKGIHFRGMKARTKKLNIYYIFNSKRFSYPAAFNQSTVQRRSSGSFKIGLRFDNQRLSFDGEQLPSPMKEELSPGLNSVELNQSSYSLSFGYAYNWVIARNCLLAGSFSPALGYTHSKGDSFTGRGLVQSLKSNLTNLDCITRLGFIYNNTRWFVGTSLIHYLYNYHRETYSFSNSVLYMNIYLGFNFSKRKEYRTQ